MTEDDVSRGRSKEFGVKAKRQKPLRSSLRSTTSPTGEASRGPPQNWKKTLVGASIARPVPLSCKQTAPENALLR